MEESGSVVKAMLAAYGFKVLAAVLILVIGIWVARIIRRMVASAMRRSRVDETLIGFLSNLLYALLIAVVAVSSLSRLGVPMTSVVAILGAAGLAVALALQGSLSNFASGVLLIMFKPFRVGDFVEGGGIAGSVEDIGIFMTRMKSPDNKQIYVPNSQITSDHIINFAGKDTRRIDMVVGVSYDDDLDKVHAILNQIMEEDERIMDDPAPTIGVLELGESSVDFAVRPWVSTADFWDVRFATLEKIKKRFDAEGVTIPFPQRVVHHYSEKPEE